VDENEDKASCIAVIAYGVSVLLVGITNSLLVLCVDRTRVRFLVPLSGVNTFIVIPELILFYMSLIPGLSVLKSSVTYKSLDRACPSYQTRVGKSHNTRRRSASNLRIEK
jgi:hypothetical protein